MSFTRLHYDACDYKQDLNENVSVLGYVLDPVKYNHCTPCRPELGLVGGNNVSQVQGNLVDLENNLFGIDRGFSRCDVTEFMPRPDGKVQGKDLYKDTKFPLVSTNPKHLPSCQFFNLPEVPVPPIQKSYQCPK
jgi:hypothetical protein